MASDLAGNVSDLPDDFFQDVPARGSVDGLPSDFFSPDESEDEVIYHEPSNKTLSMPSGLDGTETDFMAQVHNGAGKNQFWGMVDLGSKYGEQLARGFGAAKTEANMPYIAVKSKLEEYLPEKPFEELNDRDKLARIKAMNDPFQAFDKGLTDIKKLFDPGVEERAQERIVEIDQIIEKNNKFFEKHGLVRPKESESTLGERIAFDIGNVGRSVLSSVGLTLLTRNPSYSAVLFSELQRTDSYQEAREKGFSPEAADQISSTMGAAEGILEAVGGSVFLKLAEQSKPIGRVLYRTLEESIQEGSQTVAEEVLSQTGGLREQDLSGGVGRVLYSMALGGLAGGTVASVVEIGNTQARERGIDFTATEELAEKIIAANPEITEEIKASIRHEASQLSSDPEKEAESAEVIKKFIAGEDIDLPKEFEQIMESLPVNPEVAELQGAITQSTQEEIDSIQAEIAQAEISEVGQGEIDRLNDKKQQAVARLEETRSLVKDVQKTDPGFIEELVRRGEQDIEVLRETLKNKRIDILESEAGKLKARLEKAVTNEAVNTLNSQLRKIDKELDALIVDQKQVAGKPVLTASQAVRMQRTAIRRMGQAFTEGVRLARKDVKAAQEQVIGALEKSGLSANDRAKFIRSIKNIQTQEQLVRRAPKLQERIVSLLEAEQARTLKSGIKKVLKTTKIKKQSGKPVGKFTADIQARLDSLREIQNMSAGEASAVLEGRLSVENIPDVGQALENSMLAVVSGDASVAQMMQTLDNIKALKAEGLAVADARADLRKSRQAKMRENARTALKAGAGDPLMDNTKLRSVLAKKSRSAVSQLTSMYSGWQDVLDIVFGSDKSGASELLMEDLGGGVSDAFQRTKGRARVASEGAVTSIMDAFGFTTEKQLLRQLRDDAKTVDLGTFTNVRGEATRLQMSKSEARKRWMEMQDPTLREAITSEYGNAYSEDMVQAIENFLTFEDVAAAKAQLEFYQSFYSDVNAVYREVYGVDLPFNEHYSPISRMHDKSNTTDDFMKEMGFRRSIAPGSLKSRTKNMQPLRDQSDMRVLQKHILEMSHFIEFFPLVQDLNAVFGKGDIRQSIEDKWGRVMLQNIDSFIKDFTAGGVTNAETFDAIDKLRVNFTTSVLGLKPALAVKQMMSFPAYAENIPTKDFMAGLLDFAANPRRAYKTLMDSEMMKARGQNMERDIKDASRSQEFSAFRKTPSFRNMLLLSIRIGDKGAIAMGGWSVYKYHINQGATHEQALIQFERATSLAQQSSDLDQLSRWQRGGSFAKLFTMFMSAPNQYLRREVGAIRKAARGKISKKELAKTLFIYHILLPSMFQLASDLGRWDEENQIRAMVLGSFNGMFIIGDVLAAAIMAIQDEDWYKTGTPIAEFISDIMGGVEDLAESDMDAEGVYEAIRGIGEGAGKLTGFPVEQGFVIGEGVADIADDRVGEGTAKILGWPPTAAEEFEEMIK